MNRLVLTALAIVFASVSTPVSAAEHFTSFTSTSGPATVASFWFTTADALNAVGGYDVLSMHGDVNGDAITGVEPNPKQPYLTMTTNSKFNFNNVLYGTGPIVDNDGVVFNTLSGAMWNIYSNTAATTDYTLSGWDPDPMVADGWIRGPRLLGTLTDLTAPPAAPARVPPTGSTVLTLEDARGYEVGRISTAGFDFTGPCCAYSYGNSLSGADNDTQRIVYQYAPITMTAFDGSAFNVTSLDAGTGHRSPTPDMVMTLTGTRRDGSTVTASLDTIRSFQSYALTGFDDLISLTFGHPAGTEAFLTFDNIAVSRSTMVPEPATWALLIAGFGMVGHAMRRRRVARAFA